MVSTVVSAGPQLVSSLAGATTDAVSAAADATVSVMTDHLSAHIPEVSLIELVKGAGELLERFYSVRKENKQKAVEFVAQLEGMRETLEQLEENQRNDSSSMRHSRSALSISGSSSGRFGSGATSTFISHRGSNTIPAASIPMSSLRSGGSWMISARLFTSRRLQSIGPPQSHRLLPLHKGAATCTRQRHLWVERTNLLRCTTL